MHEPSGFNIMTLLPLFLLGIPFALGNYFVADRMGKNRVLWVIISLIPVVNFFFLYYLWYVVVVYVLDRLNQVAPRPQ